MQLKNKNIVFFDGRCGLCDHFVNLLLKLDHSNKLLFCPLESKKAQEIIGKRSDNTVLFYVNEIVYEKSEAVLRIFITLNPLWRILSIFSLIPKSVRDSIYMIVSRNRYKAFGKNEVCRIPTENEKTKFL